MKTLMIDIMLNDRFYAAFRYKYCPAFKFDIEDMTNKVYERYPTLRKRAMNGEKVVFMGRITKRFFKDDGQNDESCLFIGSYGRRSERGK